MRRLPAVIVWAALALPAPVAAAPAPRQPTGKWVLDYGPTACTAIRSYGSAAKPVTLAFRPSPNGAVVRLIVARPGQVRAAYHFPVTTNASGGKLRTSGLRFTPKQKKADFIWINFQRTALEPLAAAREIAIDGGEAIDSRFALPGFAALLKALDKCNSNLRSHWNLGDAASVATPAEPLKPLNRYFDDRDYPAQAFQERKGGATSVMMMIGDTGKLEDCLVEETSGIATLDAMACAVLIERAKFRPALDSAGKAVRSVLTQRILWRIVG